MNAGTKGRRSVAWQLAAGAAGLSVALGGSVLFPGLAAAADFDDETWVGPVITGHSTCESTVTLEFAEVVVDEETSQNFSYWANVSAAPEAGSSAGDVVLDETEWQELTVLPFGDGLAAEVPLTDGKSYRIVLEAREDSFGSFRKSADSEPLDVAVSGAPCGTENPGTQDPGTQDPGTQDPGTQDPGTQDPGTQDPGTQDPGTQDPGTQDPGTQDPGTEDPGTEEPTPEKPVDIPVTPVKDPGGTPQVPSAPIVPTTVPSTPLKLTTDQGADTELSVGEKLTIKGEGFMPFSSVSVIIYSEPRVLTTVLADAQGRFEVEVTVPSDLPAGNHSLVASGVDPDGNEHFLRLDVTVDEAGAVAVTTASSSGGALAFTGAEPLVPALLGGATLVGGGLLVLVSRRRKAAQQD
ncbi:hypothetical protein [Geodermatophilus sp. SYSU D00766]